MSVNECAEITIEVLSPRKSLGRVDVAQGIKCVRMSVEHGDARWSQQHAHLAHVAGVKSLSTCVNKCGTHALFQHHAPSCSLSRPPLPYQIVPSSTHPLLLLNKAIDAIESANSAH